MRKKRIKLVGVILFILALLASWVIYSFAPSSYECNLSYAKNLVERYQDVHLKQFSCFRVTYDEGKQEVHIYFSLKTSPQRKFSLLPYSSDDCIKDIANIRTETRNYLQANPENELNTKKIQMIFNTYADESMRMYNYDFQSNDIKEEVVDFLFFNDLELQNVSVLNVLSDAEKIVFYGCESCNVKELEALDDFHNLKMLDCPKSFSVEMLSYLAGRFPDCKVIQ